MDSLGLRLLGPFEVLDGDRRVDLPGGKATTLLAVLAINANTRVSIDRLTEALWPGADPRNPVASLQVYVSNLRRALGDNAERVVERDHSGYILRIAPDQVDVTQFETLATQGQNALAGQHWEEAGDLLRDALALWRGPALPDYRDEPFALGPVTRWEEARLTALEDRVDADLALGRHGALIAEIQELVVDHPFRERLVGQLMVSLYRAGRQAEALRAYQRLRHDLADQLGIEPSAAVTALDLQILQQDRELDWIAPPETDAMWAETTAGFVGRAAEAAALRAAFTDTTRGARMAVIVGEAGIGKTRLAQKAAAEAVGATVLWGAGFEGGWFRPYGPFGEALEGYVIKNGLDRLAEMVGPAATILGALLPGQSVPETRTTGTLNEQRAQVYDAFVQWLRALATQTPVVLVLDDMQWMDRGTLELTRYLLHALSRQRILIIGTYRDTDISEDHPLQDEVRRLRGQQNYLELHLDGYTIQDVAELAAAHHVAASLAAEITRHTGGNPFYVREVLADLATDRSDAGAGSAPVVEFVLGRAQSGDVGTAGMPTPPDLRRLIESRIDHLDQTTQALLTTASVEGMSFSLSVIARAADLEEGVALDAIDRVLHARIVQPGKNADVYIFTGALVRDVFYAKLTPSRRVRSHRRIAEALEEIDASPAELARHFHLSRDLPGSEHGVEHALHAAEQAEHAGAHEDAASMLEIALDLLPRQDPRRAGLLARSSYALAWSLRFDAAASAATEAAALTTGPEAADVLATTATVIYQAGSSRHARAVAQKGLTYATDHNTTSWALLTLIATPAANLAEPERREAARTLKAQPIPRFGFLYGALEAVYDSRQEVLDDPSATAIALLDRAGDFVNAANRFEHDAEESERSGRLAWGSCCWAEAARAHAALGHIDRANALIARAGDLMARVGARGWLNGVLLGVADEVNMAVDGDAGAAFQSTPPDFQSRVMQIGAGIGHGVLPAAYARTFARLGDADTAMESFRSVIPAIAETPAWVLAVHRVASDAAETLWYLNRADEASIIETALRDKVLAPDFRRSMMDARHGIGRLCAVTGRHDEAQGWFDEARVVLDEQGARPLRAVVDFDEALMWSRVGERVRALAALAAATSAFEAMELGGWITRAARLRTELRP